MRLVFVLIGNLLRLLFLPFLLARRERAAPAGAYVAVEIDGRVGDVAGRRFRLPLFGEREPSITVQRLSQIVDAVLADPAPRGLVVTLRSLRAGMATATSVRQQ